MTEHRFSLRCATSLLLAAPGLAQTQVAGPFLQSPPSRALPIPSSAAQQEPAHDGADAAAAAVYSPPHSPLGVDVVLSSGELRYAHVDLVIDGGGRGGLVQERTYRSRLDYDGPLGRGWDFPLGERLWPEPSGDVVRTDGHGRVARWVRNPGGGYDSPVGYFSTLIQTGNGGFALREVDGTKHLFDAGGRLVRREDTLGNGLDLVYGGGGELRRVVDAFGRVTRFHNELVAGRRRLVRVVDFTGREVVYTYDALGHLIAVRGPVIVGTSTGDDFPAGRAEEYAYSAEGRLVSIRRPREVADGGPPAFLASYGTNGLETGRLVSATLGGTDTAGATAGGTFTIAWQALNPGQPLGQPGLPRLEALVTERNGNSFFVRTDELGHRVLSRRFTRGLRPGEPPYYDTTFTYDADGQLLVLVYPRGNRLECTWDATGPRAAQRNLLELRRAAGPLPGGEDLVTTFTYESFTNLWRTRTDPRGNSATFVPCTGTASAARYTTTRYFDYQENTDPLPCEAEFGIVVNVPRGLGDLNSDGLMHQVGGRVVRVEGVPVELEPGSNQALFLGSTTQQALTELQYNDAGQLTARIDGEGNLHTREYFPENDPDGDGTLVPGNASTLPRGLLVATGQDMGLTARRTATAPPAMKRTELVRDARGFVVAEIAPNGVETDYEVNALGELVELVRGADVVQAVLRGQLVTGEAAKAYATQFFHDANGSVVQTLRELRDTALGGPAVWVATDQVFDILGQRVELRRDVDASHQVVTRWERDPDGNETAVTLPRGNRHVTTVDERHLPFRITLGAGSSAAGTYTRDYDDNGNLVRITDAKDTDGVGGPETRTWEYDGFDRPVQETDEIGTTRTTAYDPAGYPLRLDVFGHPAAQPAAAHVHLAGESFWYDEAGRLYRRLAELFVPSGQAPVNPIVLHDGNSDGYVQSTVESDRLSRPTHWIEDDGQTTSAEYDGASRHILETDALGNSTRTDYDLADRPIHTLETEVSPEGLVPDELFDTWNVFEQLGQLVRSTNAAGETMRFDYDSFGNRVRETDSVGAGTMADPWNVVPVPITTEGNETRAVLDRLDRYLEWLIPMTITGEGGGALDFINPFNSDGETRVAYTWDDNGNLVEVKDDNDHSTTFVYDMRDQLAGSTDANGDTTSIVRNADGQVTQVNQPAGTFIWRVLDAAGRPIAENVGGAVGVEIWGTAYLEFAYDGVSNVVRKNSVPNFGPNPFEKLTVDSLGRVCEENLFNGAASTGEYSGDGKLLSLMYANGTVVDYTYDPLDRPKSLVSSTSGPILDDIRYIGPGSRELDRIFSTGVHETHLNNAGDADVGWDLARREVAKKVRKPGSGPVLNREYAWDNAGNLRSELRIDDGNRADLITRNSLYQVTGVQLDTGATPHRDPWQFDWLVDGAANRREETATGSAGSSTTPWIPEADDAYASVAGVPQTNDDNGNRFDDGSFQFQHAGFGELTWLRELGTFDPERGFMSDADGRLTVIQDWNTQTGSVDSQKVLTRFQGKVLTVSETVTGSTVDDGQFYHFFPLVKVGRKPIRRQDDSISRVRLWDAAYDATIKEALEGMVGEYGRDVRGQKKPTTRRQEGPVAFQVLGPQAQPPFDLYDQHWGPTGNLDTITFGSNAAITVTGTALAQSILFDPSGNFDVIVGANADPPPILHAGTWWDPEAARYFSDSGGPTWDPAAGTFEGPRMPGGIASGNPYRDLMGMSEVGGVLASPSSDTKAMTHREFGDGIPISGYLGAGVTESHERSLILEQDDTYIEQLWSGNRENGYGAATNSNEVTPVSTFDREAVTNHDDSDGLFDLQSWVKAAGSSGFIERDTRPDFEDFEEALSRFPLCID